MVEKDGLTIFHIRCTVCLDWYDTAEGHWCKVLDKFVPHARKGRPIFAQPDEHDGLI